jgi:hypothetical protein
MPTVHSVRDGQRFAVSTSLVVVHCHSCGMPYGIPEELQAAALRHHGDRPGGWVLHCPLGHEWFYVGKTREERLREQIQDARDLASRRSAELDQTKAELRGARSARSRYRNDRDRLRRRAAAGVCPCCNRTFGDLAAHMAGEHPDFPPVEPADR